jgi:hypothetical protein
MCIVSFQILSDYFELSQRNLRRLKSEIKKRNGKGGVRSTRLMMEGVNKNMMGLKIIRFFSLLFLMRIGYTKC